MSEISSHHSKSVLASAFRKLLDQYNDLEAKEIKDFLRKHSHNRSLMEDIRPNINYWRALKEIGYR